MNFNIGQPFVSGVDRLKGENARVAHLYDDREGEMIPLCKYGYNRGENGFSILRGWRGYNGICKLCTKRLEQILKTEETR